MSFFAESERERQRNGKATWAYAIIVAKQGGIAREGKESARVCKLYGPTCEEKACMNPEGTGAKGCPTLSGKADRQKAHGEYRKKEVAEFARQASIQEGECYVDRDKKPYVMHPVKPRMQEICEFAHKMGYSRLGLAFCAGLAKEAAVVDQILKNHGFETVSVVCKSGAVPKEEIGVRDDQKIHIGEHESMCNPILQAMLLNNAAHSLQRRPRALRRP